jgi:hypothetical protein
MILMVDLMGRPKVEVRKFGSAAESMDSSPDSPQAFRAMRKASAD